MNKLVTIFSFIIICNFQIGLAQNEPTKSETIKWAAEGVSAYCIKLSDNNIISVRKTIQSGNLADYFNIILFDSDLKIISSGKVTPQHKESFFLQIGVVGEKIFLLSYYSDRKRKKFVAVVQEINLKDYSVGDEFILSEVNQTTKVNYNEVYYIDDKFDIFTDLNPRVYFNNETIKVVTNYQESIRPVQKLYTESLSLIDSTSFKKTSKAIIQDEIDTDILTDIPNTIKFKSIDENNQAGAFCVNNSTSQTTSLQGLRYNNEKEEVNSEFKYVVNPKEVWKYAASYIYKINEKKIAKGKAPLDLDFFYRHAILNPDNTTTFIFEQAIFKLREDDGTEVYLTTSYARGVLQTINVSEDGGINWTTVIPKRQTSYGRDNLIGYRVLEKKDGTLIFAYVNVEPGQPNTIQVTSLSSEGELDILTTYEIPEKMIDVKANYIKYFYDNTFYLPFIEKKQEGILKFTL